MHHVLKSLLSELSMETLRRHLGMARAPEAGPVTARSTGSAKPNELARTRRTPKAAKTVVRKRPSAHEIASNM